MFVVVLFCRFSVLGQCTCGFDVTRGGTNSGDKYGFHTQVAQRRVSPSQTSRCFLGSVSQLIVAIVAACCFTYECVGVTIFLFFVGVSKVPEVLAGTGVNVK